MWCIIQVQYLYKNWHNTGIVISILGSSGSKKKSRGLCPTPSDSISPGLCFKISLTDWSWGQYKIHISIRYHYKNVN